MRRLPEASGMKDYRTWWQEGQEVCARLQAISRFKFMGINYHRWDVPDIQNQFCAMEQIWAEEVGLA